MYVFAQRLAARIVAGLAAVIIAAAALSLVARIALPQVDLLRVQVVDSLSRVLGAQVTMGGLDARLRGFAPELTLHDAQLRDRSTGELLLALRELRVDLDLSASLRERGLRIDGVTLVAAELAVIRDTDGKIVVRGLDGLQGDDPGAGAFFLRRGRFSLADSSVDWTDLRAGVPTVHLRVDRLDLYNRGVRHLLSVQARPAGETRGDLTLLADFTGSAYQTNQWSGELYLRWHGNDLAQLLLGRLPAGIDISSTRVQIESWNRIERGSLRRALAQFDIGGMRLRGHEDPGRLDLGNVHALAQWLPIDGGWHLRLADMALAGFELPSADLRLDRLRMASTSPTSSGAADEQTANAKVVAPALAERRFDEQDPVPTQLRFSGKIDALPLALLPRLAAMAPGQESAALRGLRRFALAGVARDLRYRAYLDAGGADANPVGGHGSEPLDWSVQGAIDGLRLEQCSTEVPAMPGSTRSDNGCRTIADQPDRDKHTRLDSLDLVFEASPGGGFIGLAPQALTIDPRPALGGVLDLQELSGDIHWRLSDDGVVDVWSAALTANTPDIDTQSRLRAQLYSFGASPLIEFSARLENGRPGNYDRLGTYLPVAIMDDGLERWLLRAVRAGTVTSGETRFHGRLQDFPGDCGSEPFELLLNISGGELDYAPPRSAPAGVVADQSALRAELAGTRDAQPSRSPQAELLGWPSVRDADGVIRFHGRTMTIDITGGTLRNSRVTSGSAEIEDLWNPSVMAVTARGDGPLSDGLWVMKNTPLSAQLSGLADAFDVTGDATLELALGIPLTKPDDQGKRPDVTFDGDLEFDGRPGLTAKALALPITELNGRLRFDNAGVRAQEIAARMDGQPVRIGLNTDPGNTEPGNSGAGSTRIAISGRTSAEELARRLPSPLWSVADGQADWQAELSLRNADLQLKAPPLRILLESDLRGLALSPPAPIGKSADEPRPLRLSTDFTGTWPMQLTLSVGDIGALLELAPESGAASPTLTRVAVALGGAPAALPTARGILIDGQLDNADLSRWLAWSRDVPELFAAGAADQSTDPSDNLSERRPAPALPVLPSRLEVGTIGLGPLRLSDVDARFSPRPNGWSIGFEATDNGGSVDLPPAGSDGTLRVRLEQLDLQPLAEPDETATARVAEPRADPRGIGRLALTVESLRYGDDALGRLLLTTEPISGGIRFGEMSLEGPLLGASASGQWTIDATDYAQTELRVDAHSDDLGQLLHALDYYSEVQGAPADAQLSLTWPGGPERFSLERARGSLSMELGAGRLLAVDPGVGRMLGLVNLSALTRRLTLDFTDVTDPGFGFDSISGSASIGGGQARLSQVELLSSTADIHITGVTNLVEHTFDQKVRVTPKVGSGVAIAGAVAGGPLVGAAVLLADKLSGGAMDRIGRQEYQVTGPWAEPKIERLSSDSLTGVGASNAGSQPASSGSSTSSPRPQHGSAMANDKGKGAPEPEPSNPFLEGF